MQARGIGIDYFQPLSFQQANPFGAGMQQGSQVFAQALQDALTRQQTQGQAITNQYLPQTLQNQNALTGAQAGLTNAQTQWFPTTAMAQLYNGIGRAEMGGAGLQRNILTAIGQPGYEAMVAKNPQMAQQEANFYRYLASAGGGGGFPGFPLGINNTGLTAQPPSGAQPQAGDIAPQPQLNAPATPQQSNTAAQSAMNTGQISPQQISMMNNLPGMGNQQNSTSDAAALQDVAGSQVIDKTVSKPIQAQRIYDESAENILKQIQPEMPALASYAGVSGHAQFLKDKAAAALGQPVSPAYKTTNAFMNVQLPAFANELRRSLGGQATDSEREEMTNLANPVWIANNFDTAMNDYNALVDIFKANSSAISQSPAQNAASLAQGIAKPPYAPPSYQIKVGGKPQSISAQDVAATAKKYNITPAQVLQHLQQAGAM